MKIMKSMQSLESIAHETHGKHENVIGMQWCLQLRSSVNFQPTVSHVLLPSFLLPMSLVPVSDDARANAKRHERRVRRYCREATQALASPIPVVADVHAFHQAVWWPRGRPVAMVTFLKSYCGCVTSTVFESTWHGVYDSSGPIGSWGYREGGTQLFVSTRYFATDCLVSCTFVRVAHPDGVFWESVDLDPQVTLMDPTAVMIRLIRSGGNGPFPESPPTGWQIVSTEEHM